MSTDFSIVCYTCQVTGPIFASSSGFYGFKVWDGDPDVRVWLGHGQSIGHHEGHDVRIVSEQVDLPWECCGIPWEDGKCPICSEANESSD